MRTLISLIISGRFIRHTKRMANLLMKAENKSYSGFSEGNESIWKGPFFFIQGSDPQFGMIEAYIEKLPNPGWDKEIQLAKECVKTINAMNPKPRFFVVCGDLVHAFPGKENRTAQENDFIKVFNEIDPDIPLVCVCGNHDIGDKPTKEAIESYRSRFGDDYFSFYCGGCMFIVLNSQLYEDPSLVQDLANEQDSWLDTQLEIAKSGKYKHVIVFQHIPWFLKDPNEEKEYFNFAVDLRLRMLKKFYDANIRAVFCGHYHRNAGGFYKDMELVVTSAIGAQLGTDKSGFRIVKLNDNSVSHEYYVLNEAPKHVSLG